jgi:hypothetical protein
MESSVVREYDNSRLQLGLQVDMELVHLPDQHGSNLQSRNFTRDIFFL